MTSTEKPIHLRIAGFVISLQADGAVYIDDGYAPFVVDGSSSEISIAVTCSSGLEHAPTCSGRPLYEASDENGKLWEILESDDGMFINVYSPEAPYALQQVCLVSEDHRSWQVWCNPNENRLLNSLAYPLGPLIMYHLTLIEDCMMIHASGVAVHGRGKIFTGVSGKGKTTMARLWFQSGAEVLNDDRLIIRKETIGYSVHNTPMFYADEPRSAQLDAIHVIHHAKQNSLRKLDGAEAVSAVLANCIQHGYRKETIDRHLAFLTEMIESVPVYEVGFVPDASIVAHIQDAGS
ncbi:MAG: hypothetical protein H6601_09640 [Flavobacteriales bacterium]|nr:hypothetical protein [Flavobacteriales bacterium]